jgi:CRP-like cAMP-binding protein
LPPASGKALHRSPRQEAIDRASQGQKITVLRFAPGDIFGGATFLFKAVEYLLSTEADSNITALEWDRAAIRSLGERFPRLHENGGLIAYAYLAGYTQRLVAATCKSAPQRLAEALMNHANEIGRRGPDGICAAIFLGCPNVGNRGTDVGTARLAPRRATLPLCDRRASDGLGAAQTHHSQLRPLAPQPVHVS